MSEKYSISQGPGGRWEVWLTIPERHHLIAAYEKKQHAQDHIKRFGSWLAPAKPKTVTNVKLTESYLKHFNK